MSEPAIRSATAPGNPPGALTAGHKKDLVLSARLAGAPGKEAIYGWHRLDGSPIQPLYLGHAMNWVDYSHGVRLVHNTIEVNGRPSTVGAVLANESLAGLLSDEGTVAAPHYPTKWPEKPAAKNSAALLPGFQASPHFGEQTSDFSIEPGVKVHLNASAPEQFSPNRPVRLVIYALPNGNTIAQTIGRRLQPGDDWHFGIQHIGAQTRFLRENPERAIYHTVQVEKNGFIHALLAGTPAEERGYVYFGPRAYEEWIQPE